MADDLVGEYVGPMVLRNDTVLHGQVTGDVIVPDGIALTCHGRVTGNLIVHADATATVYGTVGGNIINHGARVRISGIVGGVQEQGGQKVVFIDDGHVLNSSSSSPGAS